MVSFVLIFPTTAAATFVKTLCCCYLLLLLAVIAVTGDLLDDVLLSSSSSIFPSDDTVGDMCRPTTGNITTTTTFDSVFSSTSNRSHWKSINLPYEEDAFLVDMIHNDNDNSRQNWQLRLGKGGQVMSFLVNNRSKESIANQALPNAKWNDLVQQLVAVNTEKSTAEHPNFIHGSGVYAYEDEGTVNPPFYNPKLAFQCSGNDCSIINWGQQAHVPTPWDSPLLYYTRYRNCGSGVIQYDMAMYHFGTTTSSERFGYLNTPWTAVRTSTFPDLLLSDPTTGRLQGQHPVSFQQGFSGADQIRNLDATGGFTTFCEDLTIPEFHFPFCIDNTGKWVAWSVNRQFYWYYCRHIDVVPHKMIPFQFEVQEANSTFPTDHWKEMGLAKESTVGMKWCNLGNSMPDGSWGWGSPGRSVTITNTQTGFSFESDYIIHYCWQGTRTFMSASVSAAVINAEFLPGSASTIRVAYTNRQGRPWKEQNSFTFVHGRGEEYPQDWHRAKSRLRYGVTNANRDGTVFTTNAIVKLDPGTVYHARKFLVTDVLSNAEAMGQKLATEAYEVVEPAGTDGVGETIVLWTDDDDDDESSTTFGASVGSSSTCSKATLVCKGDSAPSASTRPLFYITCGTNTITTHDPYYLDATTNGTFKRPYRCKLNESDSNDYGRAEWKLLGFFEDGACLDTPSIGSREYVSDFCELRVSSSSTPSSLPTLSPSSEIPSSIPSDSSSSTPSSLPTLSPSSEIPSSIPSDDTSSSDTPSTLEAASDVPSDISSSNPPSPVPKCTFCYNDGPFNPLVFYSNVQYCKTLHSKTTKTDQKVSSIGTNNNCLYPQLFAAQLCGCPPVKFFDRGIIKNLSLEHQQQQQQVEEEAAGILSLDDWYTATLVTTTKDDDRQRHRSHLLLDDGSSR